MIEELLKSLGEKKEESNDMETDYKSIITNLLNKLKNDMSNMKGKKLMGLVIKGKISKPESEMEESE